MLKSLIENSVHLKQRKLKEEKEKEKGDEVPFQYNNELEIVVKKSDEVVKKLNHK
jgi:hypothetical protein